MIRLLLSCAIRRISIRSLYSLWVRASGVVLVLWVAALTATDSWIAKAGLTAALITLLVGGIILFVFGIRDLIHDLRRFLRMRSVKKSHA
jgi:hypothetical protein